VKKTVSASPYEGFTAGPCEHCDGTGRNATAFIKPAALADMLELTERRLRQLVDDGIIDPPVKGKGYPGDSVGMYMRWKFAWSHANETKELIEIRKEKLEARARRRRHRQLNGRER
jgi:hypothetical protein